MKKDTKIIYENIMHLVRELNIKHATAKLIDAMKKEIYI